MTLLLKGNLNNYGFCLTKKQCDDTVLKLIRDILTIKPKDEFIVIEKNDTSTIMFYEDDETMVLPKFFINQEIKKNFKINNKEYNTIKFEINKYKYKNEKRKYDFIGFERREYQKKITDDIMKIFSAKENKNKPKGGIMKISCGSGKTFMAIYIAQLLGLKTLVVVPKNYLIGQWTEEIKSQTTASIGIIKREKVDVKDKDIVLASMRSLCMREYDQSIFEGFGLVIYDEVHGFTSKVNSNCLLKTSFEYTIGLSATPENIRGLENVLKYSIGEIIAEYDRKLDFRVIIKKINFRSENPEFRVKKRKMWNAKKKRSDEISNVPIMINDLMLNDERNNLIVKIINYVKSLNRNIFIFSSRIEHLEILKKKIDAKLKEDKEEHIYNTYFYTGETKQSERDKASKDGNILCCSAHLTQEGLNIKNVTTLIYALPFNSTDRYNKQSSGRIIRSEKLDKLLDIPMIIDICDLIGNFTKWSQARDELYEEQNYYQQSFNWIDTNYTYKYYEDDKKNPMNIMFDDICDEKFIEDKLIIKK